MRFWKWIFIVLIMLVTSRADAATVYHAKFWTVGTIIGSFQNHPHLKYYLEPQVRLIDDKYKFNQFLFLPGLGYQFTPNVMAFIGPGWIITKTPQGEIHHEYRVWEQLNWRFDKPTLYLLNSRTRLEERKRTDQSQIALRFRQRLWLRIPLQRFDSYYLSLYDEVFFNLNHPSWTSQRFFEQNRAFVGIGKQLTKYTILDVGYLNQLQWNTTNQVSNVLLVSFSVTS